MTGGFHRWTSDQQAIFALTRDDQTAETQRVNPEVFVAIDHGGGLRSTYSWLASSSVEEGDAVFAGDAIARSGAGHPGSSVAHVHFGAKRDGIYVDPLSLLAPAPVVRLIHLVPVGGSP